MKRKATDALAPLFPKGLSRPALRALARAGLTSPDKVARVGDEALLALHGMGPRAITLLRGDAAAPSHRLDADPRATRLTTLCLALPGATHEVFADHVVFRVLNRPFAYYLADHDHDGITSVCCRAARGENEDRARREPARFYLPRYIGKRGWFGLRLDRGRIDWKEVHELLAASHALAASTRQR